ncbi:MAG: RNA polymerase II elongation factor [Sclerophora amabilis]|nr:MAG: RNA polymerase II elongation factor [Sclerophora amabilis]
MDAKEIASTLKILNKASTAGEPAAIISILENLKKNVSATEELLRSTKVGVVVNRQKQHPNKEVAQLASQIVSKWREDVKVKASPAKETNGAAPKSSDGDAAANAGTSGSKITVPPDQRDWKKDKVDVKRTGNSARDNCLGLIYNGLCYMSEEAPTLVLKRACDIERAAMQEYGPETESAYKTKLRSLFQNLKNKSNPELRERILSGDISPERFVLMTHDELKSAERRAEDAKIQKENMNKAMVAQAEKSVSTSLTCGKCGQKKVSYTEAQTRSADEPMTVFAECVICGNRWRQ